MIKFFNYSGTKIKYVKQLNSYINRTSKSVYIEPFVGSGAVFFNLERQFDEYILNDIDANIIRMYKTFKEIDYDYYLEVRGDITKTFGTFKKHDSAKENYYNFRNWFNETHFGKDSILEGLYLHVLSNTCINSFLRFGPNGMNQSFGNRDSVLTEDMFNSIHNKLSSATLLNKRYEAVLDASDVSDSCVFLDPPYFSQKSSYAGFNENDLVQFINRLSSLKGDYVYTDILNGHNAHLNKSYLREIVSTSPNNPGTKRNNFEYIFYNNSGTIKAKETL